MKIAIAILALVAGPALSLAQSGPYYQPAVPQAPAVAAYGGWPGYNSGGTPASCAMNGMANLTSARGNYNLSTSAAAINMTQAQHNEIQNYAASTNTYFQMRQANTAYRKAEREPNLSTAQLDMIAQQEAPKTLSANQVDAQTGAIAWPPVLQDDSYAASRAIIDELVAKRAAQGSLGFSDQMKILHAGEAMVTTLEGQIRGMPPSDYLAAKHFLQSLVYQQSGSVPQ